jgi:hypothetical protein
MERAGAEELELSAELMWDPERRILSTEFTGRRLRGVAEYPEPPAGAAAGDSLRCGTC